MRLFTCKKLRYIWNTTTKEFVKIRSLGPGMSTASMHHPEAQLGMAGLSPFEQLRRYYIDILKKIKNNSLSDLFHEMQ